MYQFPVAPGTEPTTSWLKTTQVTDWRSDVGLGGPGGVIPGALGEDPCLSELCSRLHPWPGPCSLLTSAPSPHLPPGPRRLHRVHPKTPGQPLVSELLI